MLNLREVGIRIAVVHQRIKKLHRFPDAHLAVVQTAVLLSLTQTELVSLVRVIQAGELTHDRRRGGIAFAEVFLSLTSLIPLRDGIFPLAETLERSGRHTCA